MFKGVIDYSGENILDTYGKIQWTNILDGSGNIIYEYEYNIKYINEQGQDVSYNNSTYIETYLRIIMDNFKSFHNILKNKKDIVFNTL